MFDAFIEMLTEIVKGIFSVLQEIFEQLMEVFPKVLSFTFWVLLGIIVLPCVFIAGNVYPSWVEWGEKL